MGCPCTVWPHELRQVRNPPTCEKYEFPFPGGRSPKVLMELWCKPCDTFLHTVMIVKQKTNESGFQTTIPYLAHVVSSVDLVSPRSQSASFAQTHRKIHDLNLITCDPQCHNKALIQAKGPISA